MKLLGLFQKRASAEIQAIAALLGAGQTYLILRAKTAKVYNGLELGKDRGWEQVEAAIADLVRLAFHSPSPGSE
jgi:hypothetical protein